MEVNERQAAILDFIAKKKAPVSNREILADMKNVTRVTIARNFQFLVNQGLLKKIGQGRNVHYEAVSTNSASFYVDVDHYFQKGPDERAVLFEHFNFDIFSDLTKIFTQAELKKLKKLNTIYQKKRAKLSDLYLKKEYERLTIEFSWKSSHIEGNTYSLIDTEILIKENREAAGHSKEEAQMILNHKYALDYVFTHTKSYKTLTLSGIEEVHDLLIKNLKVERGLRKRAVGIVGTRYKPLDNKYQIREALEGMIKTVNKSADPFSKALLTNLLIAYIQPFEDGNKRTSRLIGNALLLAHSVCPLSYRSIDEGNYKKALILFYERNDLSFLKKLFMEQFEFAIETYF